MLPMLSKDGKPFLPSWVYTGLGLSVIFFGGSRYGKSGTLTIAVGLILLLMSTGIEVAVNRFRIERLERENQALRRLLGDDGQSDREPE